MIVLCGVLVLAASCKKDEGGDKGDKKERKRDRKRDRDDDDDGGAYVKRAKKSEAMIQLKKIQMKAKEEYAVNGTLPVAKIPLTPATVCCAQNFQSKLKCEPKQSDWAGDWQKLDFSMDEPFLFQYSYESDGKSFTAKAVGDLDCDTTMITYEARGSVVNGNLQVDIVEPPPNSD
jgi:hypothetical protein